MNAKKVRAILFGVAAAVTIVAPHYVFAACDWPYCPPASATCPLGCWPVESWISAHCYYGTQGECCECTVEFFRCRCNSSFDIVFKMSSARYPGWYCRQLNRDNSVCSPTPPPPDNP